MKSTINFFKLKKLMFLPFLVLMLMMSCQNEETEIINPSNNDIIEDDSTAANLMARMATNDGSVDNIIDYANCLEVVLPVTVTANGITITIQSVADYSQLENILDAFTNDDDAVDITFPITVILNDYTEIVITSQQQLEELIDDCVGENEDDDDIECIDFIYPVSFSIYNTDFQVIDTVTINDDEALYDFLEDLDGPILASLDFPVSLVTASGETVVVNSNEELEAAISDADGTCDEDDDYDWNDDDDNCLEENIELNLKECVWVFTDYNGDDVFDDYYIDFDASYEFMVYDPSGNPIHDGTWSVAQDGAVITLTFTTDWEDLAGDWTIVNCDDDDEYNLDNGQINMQIEQDCNTNNDNFDCFSSFDAEIVKCDENLDGFEVFDLTVAFSNCTDPSTFNLTYHMSLMDAETGVNALPNPETYTNTSSPETIYVRAELLSNGNYEIFELNLILEDCGLNCSISDVNTYLQTCVWNVVNLNGSDNLLNFNLTFEDNGEIAITDTSDGNFYSGDWSVIEVAGDIVLELTNVAGPNIQAITDYWKVIDCDSDRLEFISGNNEIMVLERDCNNCENPGFLSNDLIIYMPFGGEAKDLISGETVQNITNNFVTDRSGNSTCAIAFTGNDDIAIPVTAQNQLVQGDNFSVSIWFKMQNSNLGNLETMFQKGTTTSEGFQIAVYDLNTPLVSDTTNGYGLWDNDWNGEVDVVWDNTDWHHLVITRDANNTIRLYRDGQLRNIDENSNFNVDLDPLNNYLLGKFFEGHLDDLRVYKRTLSANDVSDLYQLEGDCYTCL